MLTRRSYADSGWPSIFTLCFRPRRRCSPNTNRTVRQLDRQWQLAPGRFIAEGPSPEREKRSACGPLLLGTRELAREAAPIDRSRSRRGSGINARCRALHKKIGVDSFAVCPESRELTTRTCIGACQPPRAAQRANGTQLEQHSVWGRKLR